MPSIETRNKAIQVMWHKKHLTKPEAKPAWAWVAEELVKRNISKTAISKVDELSS